MVGSGMTKMKGLLMRAPPTVRKWPLFALAHYGFEANGGNERRFEKGS